MYRSKNSAIKTKNKNETATTDDPQIPQPDLRFVTESKQGKTTAEKGQEPNKKQPQMGGNAASRVGETPTVTRKKKVKSSERITDCLCSNSIFSVKHLCKHICTVSTTMLNSYANIQVVRVSILHLGSVAFFASSSTTMGRKAIGK